MKLTFHINYWTHEDQQILLLGSAPELGNSAISRALPMRQTSGGNWTLTVELYFTKALTYQFLLANGDEITFEPSRQPHQINLNPSLTEVCIYDCWKEQPPDSIIYTSAFIQNLFAQNNFVGLAKPLKDNQLLLKITCPAVPKDCKLSISGNQATVGCWSPALALDLLPTNFPEWEISFDREQLVFPFEYKFLLRTIDGEVCCWESGENRLLPQTIMQPNALVVYTEYPFRAPAFDWKGAGTVLPIFSLRSEKSFGIGDVGDLKLLIDWAAQTGQSVVQILPINDTTHTHSWVDSYPYSAISTYALHPIYMALHKRPELVDATKRDAFEALRLRLNAKEVVDYDAVEDCKLQYTKVLFEQEGQEVLCSESYQFFLQKNQFWLKPYAVFCYLRDTFGTADFAQWGEYAVYDASQIDALVNNQLVHQTLNFVFYQQFILYTQFKEVFAYSRQKRIVLKGDLPIGIHPHSVEAWIEPHYFNHQQQAGAPPDFFSKTGQNWSFPTYNWEIMQQDGYRWWKNRLDQLGEFFDCLRIDHILGFFRIWEIPKDYIQGLCGHFRPALPLSVAEMADQYGFRFETSLLKPIIHCKHLEAFFGDQAKTVTEQYLDVYDLWHVTLKEYCCTQRKIEAVFSNSNCDQDEKIKQGLFAITHEVLFVEDPYTRDKYHPRILGSSTFRYEELSAAEKHAFDKLSYDFFYVRHNEFWKDKAIERLQPLLKATPMLICGEDLGMLPKSVPWVMNQLQILSLELERTPKKQSELFTNLQQVPYLSVTTTSTHDMTPLRAWWREDLSKTQIYYHQVLNQMGLVPRDCSSTFAKTILANHLNAASILTIIPLQDWFAKIGRAHV